MKDGKCFPKRPSTIKSAMPMPKLLYCGTHQARIQHTVTADKCRSVEAAYLTKYNVTNAKLAQVR